MKLAAELEPMFAADQIARRVKELGGQIERDYQGKELVLLGVLKGSYIFISDLARAIDLPLSIDFIGLSSYGEATESSGVVKITSDLTRPIERKHVVIVEDIVDTGLTMRYLLDNNFPYLVAETAGEVCGYAYAGPYRARPAYRWTVEDSVYIAPTMFRRGIGRGLLVALIQAAEAREFRQMIAVIGDSVRQGSSVNLHEALGFSHVGILQDVGFKHGRWLDSVIMQRVL